MYVLSEKWLSHVTPANVLAIAIWFSFGHNITAWTNETNVWSFILHMNLDASNYLSFEVLVVLYFLISCALCKSAGGLFSWFKFKQLFVPQQNLFHIVLPCALENIGHLWKLFLPPLPRPLTVAWQQILLLLDFFIWLFNKSKGSLQSGWWFRK